jgi:hypothetical protein
MGYSDVVPLSMLQHIQMNLDDYRASGKKSKKSLSDEIEEKINPGVCWFDVVASSKAVTYAIQPMKKAKFELK